MSSQISRHRDRQEASLMLVFMLSLGLHAHANTSPVPDIEAVIDGFHHAAAVADERAYFQALTDDAVFIGTDASERWTRDAFRAWAAPHFERDSAWIYHPAERHVQVAADGKTAWFDEKLKHKKYGETRGSGVLVRTKKSWKIAQYVLSFPIPNDVAADVVQIVTAHKERVEP
jgi:ketosteroid isomerase-like protein